MVQLHDERVGKAGSGGCGSGQATRTRSYSVVNVQSRARCLQVGNKLFTDIGVCERNFSSLDGVEKFLPPSRSGCFPIKLRSPCVT